MKIQLLGGEADLEENILASKGFLTVDDITYVFKKGGATSKYKNKDLEYSFNFSSPIEYTVNKNSKKNSDIYVLQNPDTDEFIKIWNFTANKGEVSFNFSTSVSDIVRSGTLTSVNEQLYSSNKCPWCVPIALAVVGAIVEFSADNYDSNCRAAIGACGSDGPSSIEIIDGGWFSASSCKVLC